MPRLRYAGAWPGRIFSAVWYRSRASARRPSASARLPSATSFSAARRERRLSSLRSIGAPLGAPAPGDDRDQGRELVGERVDEARRVAGFVQAPFHLVGGAGGLVRVGPLVGGKVGGW